MRQFENLANAIVLQAVKDYRGIRRYLESNPCDSTAALELDRLEKFFRSEEFRIFTNLDGETLLRRLREEAGP